MSTVIVADGNSRSTAFSTWLGPKDLTIPEIWQASSNVASSLNLCLQEAFQLSTLLTKVKICQCLKYQCFLLRGSK